MWYLSIKGGNLKPQALSALLFEWFYPSLSKSILANDTKKLLLGGCCHNVISLDLRRPRHQILSCFPIWSKQHKSCVSGLGETMALSSSPSIFEWVYLRKYQNDLYYRRFSFYNISGFMAPNSLHPRWLSQCDISGFEDFANPFIYRTLNKLTLSKGFLSAVVAEVWYFWIGRTITSTAPHQLLQESHESANFSPLEVT